MKNRISRLEKIAAAVPVDSAEAKQWYLQSNPDKISCEAAEQYWGLPYDEKYLVLSFGSFEFKHEDIIALSESESVADEGEEAFETLAHAFTLKNNTWLTPLAVSRIAAGKPLYLHYFFLKDNHNEPASVSHLSFKVYDSSMPLPSVDNSANVDGVAVRPHSGIAPQDIPQREIPQIAAAQPELDAELQSGGAYEKLFLSFSGETSVILHCYPSSTVDSYDYIAYNTHAPTDAYDYIGSQYQYVVDLNEGTYYPYYLDVTNTCYKYVNNSSWWVLDLDEACKWKIFYARKNRTTGKWYILGDLGGFSVYPTWMYDNLSHIGPRKLHEIAIPGTHDSGVFDVYAKKANASYCQTQNLSFADQLKAGVRYFDCRLYVYEHVVMNQNGGVAKHGEYFFNHGDYVTYTELASLIRDVGNFLSTNKEIVILDFSRFDKFTTDDYKDFFNRVTQDPKLSPLLANGAHTTETIKEMMDNNHRLVLLFDDINASWASGYHLSPSINIHAEWGNTILIEKLKTWLRDQINMHANFNSLWCLQAVLTPVAGIPPLYASAHWANPAIAKLIYDSWWDKVNIVFSDYVCEGGMIQNLIEANRRKFP